LIAATIAACSSFEFSTGAGPWPEQQLILGRFCNGPMQPVIATFPRNVRGHHIGFVEAALHCLDVRSPCMYGGFSGEYRFDHLFFAE